MLCLKNCLRACACLGPPVPKVTVNLVVVYVWNNARYGATPLYHYPYTGFAGRTGEPLLTLRRQRPGVIAIPTACFTLCYLQT